MSGRLIDSLATTPALAALFSDSVSSVDVRIRNRMARRSTTWTNPNASSRCDSDCRSARQLGYLRSC